jgi:deoxyribodipyrimidine photo-lyase
LNSSSPPREDSQTIIWFRRDLRLKDNAGLYHALRENSNVLPVFVFDTVILEKLEDATDRRVEFIHQSLHLLKQELEQLGTSILILHGDPAKLFEQIAAKAVYTNYDYEPYARQRDEHVRRILQEKGIPFYSFKDQVIFDRDEVVKDDGTPYTIFTPYRRKWLSKITPFYLKSYPTEKYYHRFVKIKPLNFPTLKDIGFEPSYSSFPDRVIRKSIIANYKTQRDVPSIQGTSRLSVHLRFGTVSIRILAKLAIKTSDTWLNELIWREFYQMILWHFPRVTTTSFKPAYDRIEWRNDPEEFNAWCEGRTGYPIVDAGMRELKKTGFMHNRVRMITASFLTKHLLIDWRWGEAYFAQKLLDFELASNNGGWQWASGSGCDAVPYFRVFNPELQARKFDPDFEYIKKWVPEFGSSQYFKPIVDHVYARDRALSTYKKALRE